MIDSQFSSAFVSQSLKLRLYREAIYTTYKCCSSHVLLTRSLLFRLSSRYNQNFSIVSKLTMMNALSTYWDNSSTLYRVENFADLPKRKLEARGEETNYA